MQKVERRKLILEQIELDLEKLAKRAEKVDEALLAHLLGTSAQEAEYALERLRCQSEDETGIKGPPKS